MLEVFVCEDNNSHLESIKKCVQNFITVENLSVEITLATTSPAEILDYLGKNKVAGLYFLDVDLKTEINGIELAKAIRSYDPRGFIAFVTVDTESLTLTFKYGVEAMDYIIKGCSDRDSRIHNCIQNAYNIYTSKATPLQNRFVFNRSKDKIKSIDCSDIVYFKVSSLATHKVELYTVNDRYEFRGTLSQIEKELDKRFFRCHRAFIVNVEKISYVDKLEHRLQLDNGDFIDIAVKNFKKVETLMKHPPNLDF